MKLLILLAVCVTVLAVNTYAQVSSINYENIDIDQILNSERLLNNYMKCVLGKGICTKEGRQLKHDIPIVIKNSCEKCTDSEKKLIRKACKHLVEHNPDQWKLLMDKYDPDGERSNELNKFLEED